MRILLAGARGAETPYMVYVEWKANKMDRVRDGHVKVHLKIPGKTLASPPALILLGIYRRVTPPPLFGSPALISTDRGIVHEKAWKVTGVCLTNHCQLLVHRGPENSLQISLSIYEDFPLPRRYLVKR